MSDLSYYFPDPGTEPCVYLRRIMEATLDDKHREEIRDMYKVLVARIMWIRFRSRRAETLTKQFFKSNASLTEKIPMLNNLSKMVYHLFHFTVTTIRHLVVVSAMLQKAKNTKDPKWFMIICVKQIMNERLYQRSLTIYYLNLREKLTVVDEMMKNLISESEMTV